MVKSVKFCDDILTYVYIFYICFNHQVCVYTFPVHDSFDMLCLKHVQVQDFSNQTKAAVVNSAGVGCETFSGISWRNFQLK